MPIEKIVEHAKQLVDGGVRELILVAQDTTKYGKDLYGKPAIVELLRKLSEIKNLSWIRLLYCYPELMTDELIDEIATNDKIVNYADIPLQHVDNAILRRMNRKSNYEQLTALFDKLSAKNIAVRSTFICGFPGETEDQHEELMQFVDEMEFDRLGVFTYSPEEDTPAAVMPDQIAEEVKEERQADLMELQQEIAFDNAENMIGREMLVMIEGKVADENAYVGRTYRDAPNVDGLIFINTEEELISGDFAKVKITGALEYDLIGELL